MTSTASEGLEDVIAGQSAICDVDGREGRLIYRGYDIQDLAEHSTFEETTHLLWHGELPARAQLDELFQQLDENRSVPEQFLQLMRQCPKVLPPMHLLRTSVSAMQIWDPDGADISPEANQRKALRLTASMPALVAACYRLRFQQDPIPPKRGLNTAAQLLYLLGGVVPDEVATRALDVSLILHADHELNASTFAARVTAATLSDMHSAITSAVGTLIGPLHGGANEGVIRMLNAIGEPSRAEEYVKGELAAHRRIPGFGHRVYKTEDPRAAHLREMSRRLGERQGDLKLWDISRRVEEVVMREKGLNANVDFYSASTLSLLGIPVELFTTLFAIARISGWTAHVLEQYANNRLIRPRAEYIGPRNRKWVPFEQRS
jgi:citrate synthase